MKTIKCTEQYTGKPVLVNQDQIIHIKALDENTWELATEIGVYHYVGPLEGIVYER